MRLAKVINKLRTSNTRFGNKVGGAVEFELAMQQTLVGETMFVVPGDDSCSPNRYDSGIDQLLTEKFHVVVALKNDTLAGDKAGVLAYNALHDVRSEIFKAILGWDIKEAESMIYYTGGKMLGVMPAYLWYMYSFEYTCRLTKIGEDIRLNGLEDKDIDEAGTTQPDLFITAPMGIEGISEE
ncbi:MAG: hypothetical protein WC479_11650 [Candidatus Izemoplasmatales bacterium]